MEAIKQKEAMNKEKIYTIHIRTKKQNLFNVQSFPLPALMLQQWIYLEQPEINQPSKYCSMASKLTLVEENVG